MIELQNHLQIFTKNIDQRVNAKEESKASEVNLHLSQSNIKELEVIELSKKVCVFLDIDAYYSTKMDTGGEVYNSSSELKSP